MPTPEHTPITPALSAVIRQATRRVRWIRARQQGANGLMIGSGLSAVVLLAERLRLLEPDSYSPEWLLAPPLIGLAVGALWGATRAIPPLALLKLLETRLDLKERLSTAHILAPTSDSTDPFVVRQIADAEAHAATGADLKKALPLLPIPRRVYYAGASVGAAFLLWFLPTLPVFQSPAERAEKASLKRDGERLVRIAKKLEAEAQNKKLDKAQNAAAKLAKLGEEMKRGRLTQQKAMMKAAKLTEELKAAQQAAAQQSSPKSLPSAAREMQKALSAAQMNSSSNSADGQKPNDANQLNAPQNSPNDKNKNAKSAAQQAMNKAVQAMSQNSSPSLAEQLSKMADLAAQNEPGNQQGREQMANQLSALADALKGTSFEKASQALKEASEALKSGDMSRASEKLREAARKVQDSAKSGEESNAMQQMAQALAGQQDGQAMEGEGFSESGEGAGEDDAFGKDGAMKAGHKHTAECLQPGGT